VVYAASAHVTCDMEHIGTERFVRDSRIPEKPRRIGATCDSVDTQPSDREAPMTTNLMTKAKAGSAPATKAAVPRKLKS
jgi:hypothetical protein